MLCQLKSGISNREIAEKIREQVEELVISRAEGFDSFNLKKYEFNSLHTF